MRSILVLPVILLASRAAALEPADVWLVVNKNVPESRQVAEHYIAKRGVPKGNVVVLDLPQGRGHLARRLRRQTRRAASRRAQGQQGQGEGAAHHLRRAAACWPGPRTRRREGRSGQASPRNSTRPARSSRNWRRTRTRQEGDRPPRATDCERLREQECTLSHAESHACVDSELMLLWWPKYRSMRWVPNPLYFQASERTARGTRPC